MERRGGSRLNDYLDSLQKDIENYYGALNQLAARINVEVPPIPDALAQYKQCVQQGIPLVDGGLIDQPYIWLKEYALCEHLTQIFEAMRQQMNNNR